MPSAHEHRTARSISEQDAPPVRWLARGDKVIGKGYEVEVLWPQRGHSPANHNNSSLVLSVRLKNGKMLLFPDDIEAKVERALLADGVNPVDAMLMPPHGSRSSSLPAFVKRMQPGLAIAQTGKDNHFGFPHAVVTSRYRASGSELANSSDGAVVVRLKDKFHPETWPSDKRSRRDMALKWWQESR
ncbi:ComEC/Rec2 family competence protein [Mariprofundus aestuarium]|uniref:ComEC/Rec2 family competence protein n=1 Tax=Mariprofundus aestuarium TaxID=1921086 RepID=UPI000C224DB6|nr:hypothetical protein [Mariprofundus aestuarium]